MLVSPAPALPSGDGWVYEVKHDGMRTLLTVDHAGVRVHSRHGRDHTDAFPELAALAALSPHGRLLLDGELVLLDAATGRPSFDRLMTRVLAHHGQLAGRRLGLATFMAFDVLEVDGTDICAKPWRSRREILDGLYSAAPDPVWRVNTAFTDGPGLLTKTAEFGLEGVVAKRTGSRYLPGKRSPHWRKVKHRTTEWFDLVGWHRPGPGKPGGLVAAEDGRVVAIAFPGLTGQERERLAVLVAEHGVEDAKGVTFPVGLAEVQVAYLERLRDGRLREPVARAVRLAL